ncbi:MAG: hypothetical protein AUJ57_09660 [Zetaproteobacteria bacterium CG1_02_53_45]|nr:MAG: hypothetical protein AUJ57_09660 [Zetaproteobacteria bacterium CG1_02_53_45]
MDVPNQNAQFIQYRAYRAAGVTPLAPHTSHSLQPLHPQLVPVVNNSIRQIYKGGNPKRSLFNYRAAGQRRLLPPLSRLPRHTSKSGKAAGQRPILMMQDREPEGQAGFGAFSWFVLVRTRMNK